jgi:hypothetical protein
LGRLGQPIGRDRNDPKQQATWVKSVNRLAVTEMTQEIESWVIFGSFGHFGHLFFFDRLHRARAVARRYSQTTVRIYIYFSES